MSQIDSIIASVFCLIVCMRTGVELKYLTWHLSYNNRFQQSDFHLKSITS